ncbi:Thoeris anti-defense Tad2 family protein [Nitratifractor salsuginis]|uniref:Thoeris anti-defense 2-like domain-containing protein n=1 Tax=Nitratifractor salsuginis (strain DSM 16511 / JCM 12458 / E9I37-1) TaxID=749222 RepID=E6WY53_NITSE|nr:MW1434 family type I TA system toxin [Nitratifractor salsuginis]ADV46427.1 hypothetical protein Nitsa_1174 [Nitratifractor salsuginis DSM 16511]
MAPRPTKAEASKPAQNETKPKTEEVKEEEAKIEDPKQKTPENAEDTPVPVPEPTPDEATEKTEGLNILEALEAAGRSRKVRRAGWPKELKHHYVTIYRGETRPTMTNGKSGSPYAPSIVDVMAKDWQIIID